MTQRRAITIVVVSSFAIVMVILSALYAIASSNDRRAQAAAEAVLPQAQAYLQSYPAYQHLNVEVSEPNGGYIWFTGSLATQAECDVLEREVEKRFGQGVFELRYTVLSRYEDKSGPASRSAGS